MIEIEEKEAVVPVCPSCKAEQKKIWYRELRGALLGKRYVYFCASCQAVLGVTHRKGFWMG